MRKCTTDSSFNIMLNRKYPNMKKKKIRNTPFYILWDSLDEIDALLYKQEKFGNYFIINLDNSKELPKALKIPVSHVGVKKFFSEHNVEVEDVKYLSNTSIAEFTGNPSADNSFHGYYVYEIKQENWPMIFTGDNIFYQDGSIYVLARTTGYKAKTRPFN